MTLRDVLDETAPYPIRQLLYSYLTIPDIYLLGRVCKSFRWLPKHLSRSLLNIDTHLQPFITDPQRFRDRLGRFDGIISRGFALNFFVPGCQKTPYLDVFVEKGVKADAFVCFLKLEELYELPESQHHVDDEVRETILLRNAERHTTIRLTLTNGFPLLHILQTACATAELNFITRDKAYSLFPSLTIHQHKFYLLRRLDDDSGCRLSEYAHHGWTTDMVRLLLQKGAKPNVVNAAGRSPLMEAALWGRLRNVELLLEYGADTETCCIRNGQRLRAVDFAMPLEENIAERESLAGGVYRENTPERDRDRAAVVRLLRGRAESPPPDRELAGFAFHHSPDNERSLVMIATFDIPNKWKIVAVLYRGGRFPGVAAMSGWGHGEKLDIQVSGKDWTQEVYDLCERIGFSLRPHDRDQGSRGKYYACHAEKQLVAYFISKHLLREDVEDVIALENLRLDDADDHAKRGQDGRHHRERLPSLEHIEPPVTLREAVIMTSRPACDDCREFVAHVNRYFRLKIMLCQ